MSENRQDFLVRRQFQAALVNKHLKDFIAKEATALLNRKNGILLAVAEVLTNIIKHAKWGRVSFDILSYNDRRALIFVAEDKGPGIKEISNAMKKGYSTAGTLGLGFNVMSNNTDFIEVGNTDSGLRVKLGWYLQREAVRAKTTRIDHYEFIKSMRGHIRCGDYIHTRSLSDNIFFAAIFDVLGHGDQAYQSVKHIRLACNAFAFKGSDEDTVGLLITVDEVLKSARVRGAVAAAGIFIPKQGLLCLAGIGNISVAVNADGHFALPQFRGGVIGDGKPRFKKFEYLIKDKLIWGMASDGFRSGWASKVKQAAGQTARGLVDAAVHDDFSDTDDSSIMVMKWKSN